MILQKNNANKIRKINKYIDNMKRIDYNISR